MAEEGGGKSVENYLSLLDQSLGPAGGREGGREGERQRREEGRVWTTT